MGSFFIIISLMSLLAIPIGLISPKIVLPGIKIKNRKMVMLLFAPLFFVTAIIGGSNISAIESDKKTVEAEKENSKSNLVHNDSIAIARESEELRLRQEEEAAKRKADEIAIEKAKKKAEEEIDSDGLVLLWKSVKATRSEYGSMITGVIENRRSENLGYAQISFNLYDKSGAQVGTAMDNINNLQSGGRWRFKAIAMEDDFSTYRFAELTGF